MTMVSCITAAFVSGFLLISSAFSTAPFKLLDACNCLRPQYPFEFGDKNVDPQAKKSKILWLNFSAAQKAAATSDSLLYVGGMAGIYPKKVFGLAHPAHVFWDPSKGHTFSSESCNEDECRPALDYDMAKKNAYSQFFIDMSQSFGASSPQKILKGILFDNIIFGPRTLMYFNRSMLDAVFQHLKPGGHMLLPVYRDVFKESTELMKKNYPDAKRQEDVIRSVRALQKNGLFMIQDNLQDNSSKNKKKIVKSLYLSPYHPFEIQQFFKERGIISIYSAPSKTDLMDVYQLKKFNFSKFKNPNLIETLQKRPQQISWMNQNIDYIVVTKNE